MSFKYISEERFHNKWTLFIIWRCVQYLEIFFRLVVVSQVAVIRKHILPNKQRKGAYTMQHV